MPTCYIVISEIVPDLSKKDIAYIRSIIAKGMNSKSRYLDASHLSSCVIRSDRCHMLADIEIEIHAQLYLRRLFSRDKRAHFISTKISEHFKMDCATWINLNMVGYSRMTKNGLSFYSDSDNKAVRLYQRITKQVSDNT